MKDLLKKAAETIDRLGRDAQDCKSCARLPMCNAYQAENRFENCDYKWVHEEESAAVQPVKHGYWKEEEPRVLKCSVCGEYAPMNYLGQNCIDSRYCPWCGARMIKGGDTNG